MANTAKPWSTIGAWPKRAAKASRAGSLVEQWRDDLFENFGLMRRRRLGTAHENRGYRTRRQLPGWRATLMDQDADPGKIALFLGKAQFPKARFMLWRKICPPFLWQSSRWHPREKRHFADEPGHHDYQPEKTASNLQMTRLS